MATTVRTTVSALALMLLGGCSSIQSYEAESLSSKGDMELCYIVGYTQLSAPDVSIKAMEELSRRHPDETKVPKYILDTCMNQVKLAAQDYKNHRNLDATKWDRLQKNLAAADALASGNTQSIVVH